MVAMPTTYL